MGRPGATETAHLSVTTCTRGMELLGMFAQALA